MLYLHPKAVMSEDINLCMAFIRLFYPRKIYNNVIKDVRYPSAEVGGHRHMLLYSDPKRS